MHERQWALVVGVLAAGVGAAVSMAEPLGLTAQHIAVLGVSTVVLAAIQARLPTASPSSRRPRRKADPPGAPHG